MLADLFAEQYSRLRQFKREEAEAAIACANATSRTLHNRAHRAMGDRI